MKIIAEATWSWMLCAEEERRWLVVVCGSVGLYECAVELSPDERAAIAADPSRIDALARQLAASPRLHAQRHQPGFLASPALAAAVSAWRSPGG